MILTSMQKKFPECYLRFNIFRFFNLIFLGFIWISKKSLFPGFGLYMCVCFQLFKLIFWKRKQTKQFYFFQFSSLYDIPFLVCYQTVNQKIKCCKFLITWNGGEDHLVTKGQNMLTFIEKLGLKQRRFFKI